MKTSLVQICTYHYTSNTNKYTYKSVLYTIHSELAI